MLATQVASKKELLMSFSLPALPAGFWLGVMTSLIATFIVIALGWLTHALRKILKFYNRFTLAGIWIGTCKLPHYPENVDAIEIYRLAITGDQISFRFFNYRSDGIIQKYLGGGIYRGHLLSAYYYIPDADKSESGVFVVRKCGETLKGVYAQYDLRAGEALKISEENFVLTRIRIPWWSRVKLALGWPPYPKHDEVRKLYIKTLESSPAVLQNNQTGHLSNININSFLTIESQETFFKRVSHTIRKK